MEKDELKEIMNDIIKRLGGKIEWNNDEIIRVEHMNPHIIPKKMPNGKMAIYIFKHGNEYLKIGKVGIKSQNRFTTQHYNKNSCRSNLAKSILKDKEMINKYGLNEKNIKDWMLNNLDRTNIYLDKSLGVYTLDLFEIVLQYKLRPRYEGYKSQMCY